MHKPGELEFCASHRLYHLTKGKEGITLPVTINPGGSMAILSAKRQITLPKDLCDRLLVEPGDDLTFLEHGGCITIIKKVKGKSGGVLRHLKADPRYSEAQSLHDAVQRSDLATRKRTRRG
jgi:bifunctional DNA-binding transcriptional regulator/antitoxin component of YhaV-PrlF toxin-antitoxin module